GRVPPAAAGARGGRLSQQREEVVSVREHGSRRSAAPVGVARSERTPETYESSAPLRGTRGLISSGTETDDVPKPKAEPAGRVQSHAHGALDAVGDRLGQLALDDCNPCRQGPRPPPPGGRWPRRAGPARCRKKSARARRG